MRPVSPEKQAAKQWPAWDETETAYQRILIQKSRQQGSTPGAFWRTVKVEPFLTARGRPHAAPTDDPGRALALALGFRVLATSARVEVPVPLILVPTAALVALAAWPRAARAPAALEDASSLRVLAEHAWRMAARRVSKGGAHGR